MIRRFAGFLFGCLLIFAPVVGAADNAVSRLPDAKPESVGLDAARLARIDAAVAGSIERHQLPGAVVLISREGKIAFRHAYGSRSLQPAETPMTVDAVFDLASLTKPIATATSVMILLERGKVRLTDKVVDHIPEFAPNGKDQITIEQLLLHTSGLIADNPLSDYDAGPEKAFERINQLKPVTTPGTKFTYSDVNYIMLGKLVERLSGEPLDVFSRKNIFEPLGLRETLYKPGEALARRAAPTEKRDGHWMQGEVHDPRSFKLGCVAGHAGLFSTADDLAVFAQMLLDDGAYQGKRILSPATVRLMTAPRPIPGGLRALGWDVQTTFSSNRGELFSAGSFGHTGFTGTSVWIDPTSRMAVIFLSNRVHPDGKGNVSRVRGQVATLAAASIVSPPFPNPRSTTAPAISKTYSTVLTGIDVLARDDFRPLQGRRIGLVTNHTGVDRQGRSTIDLLHQAKDLKLVALFSPEHGIRGKLDQKVGDGKDEKTGLPVYSLYGERRKPTAQQLEGIDTLVYDIQDIGCRFYTYLTTLGFILETAAQHKINVVVLDRPNPIGGLAVEGPILDKDLESFVGYHPLPVRHGMTLGELAQLFNRERKINADLQVIQLEGWKREQLFDQTGLSWVDPSPNMRSLAAALLYPAIGLLETTNVSVGRGTDRPFEMIGAPWIDGRQLADKLNHLELPGVRFVPTRFTPSGSTHAGKECGGVQIYLDDWKRFAPLPTGIAIACELKRLYAKVWQSQKYLRLLCNRATLAALERGDPAAQIVQSWKKELDGFSDRRKGYLIYP
ncbi:MAG TPA: exo-beta-N-acetylmuramidase NamZ domain-containing protein [Gemmataceae bacterium]|nr:exo-beta-N-acetylmuramidase NamZ domain-containing protein [Gemmataceae bacterium]